MSTRKQQYIVHLDNTRLWNNSFWEKKTNGHQRSRAYLKLGTKNFLIQYLQMYKHVLLFLPSLSFLSPYCLTHCHLWWRNLCQCSISKGTTWTTVIKVIQEDSSWIWSRARALTGSIMKFNFSNIIELLEEQGKINTKVFWTKKQSDHWGLKRKTNINYNNLSLYHLTMMWLLDDHLLKTSVLKTEIRFIETKSNTKSMNNIIQNFHSLRSMSW